MSQMRDFSRPSALHTPVRAGGLGPSQLSFPLIFCVFFPAYICGGGGGADIESYNVFHCVFLLFNSVYMCMLLTCTNGAVMHICTDVNKTILLCHSLPWHREVIARIFRNSLQLIYHIVRTHSEVLRQSQYVPHLALHECLEFCRRLYKIIKRVRCGLFFSFSSSSPAQFLRCKDRAERTKGWLCVS